ncbi:MAG: hypothetical protein HY360_17095 [Verrucomicrobia bacterium]|nr:hypothetical protein [Verrucomicrobiota bacterium]
MKPKQLHATADIYDDFLDNARFYEKSHLDALMAYLRKIGVTRLEWIFDAMWTFYEDYPPGFDLLAYAAEAAHAHGLEFIPVIKPFEGGLSPGLPHTLPLHRGSPVLSDLRGIHPVIEPFVAAHPDMRLKRRPGDWDPGGAITEIRLVKGDDHPTRLRPEHLSIWTSPTNNHFQRYTGPLRFEESVEWRKAFPLWRKSRILSFKDLRIPESERYALVRCALADCNGDFANERAALVELVAENNQILPATPGSGPVKAPLDDLDPSVPCPARQEFMTRYARFEEARKELCSREKMRWHYQDFFSFDDTLITQIHTLDVSGWVAVARGKAEHLVGALHPIYPEVQQHWLSKIRYCLDRGADGINIRVANHNKSHEIWEYGFNEPVLEKTGGEMDLAAVAKINGDAFTDFLRQAARLIKGRGKLVGVHLHPDMLHPDDRSRLGFAPQNFDWQWETWVGEIADYAEFRGGFALRPWNERKVIDRFSAATRAAGRPLFYQSSFKELHFEGDNFRLREECDLVCRHPRLDGLMLYETAMYTRINDRGDLEGSPDVARIAAGYLSS